MIATVQNAPDWHVRVDHYRRWDGLKIQMVPAVDGVDWELYFPVFKYTECSETHTDYLEMEPIDLPPDATFQQVLAYVDSKYPMAPWWRPTLPTGEVTP